MDATLPAPGLRLDRATIAATIGHITEVSAVLVAVGYGLGIIALAGDLREAGLQETSVLTGFAHDDVLMKGFGLLLTHVPSLLTVILLLGMALSRRSREYVGAIVAPHAVRERAPVTLARGQLVASRLALAALVLATALLSVWWEGTLVVLALYAYLTFAWRRSWLMTTGPLLAAALLGALVVGFVGAYVHPQPLPEAEIHTSAERTISGALLGQGQRGDWYVVEGGDTTRLQLVPAGQVATMHLTATGEEREPTLYDRILGR